jgi:hypothetical protein
MTHLSLEEVINLLSVDNINCTPKQMERLRRWIECLAEKRGDSFVVENSCKLLDQWEKYIWLNTHSCC